jgi:lysophospholipase L1-like esterase
MSQNEIILIAGDSWAAGEWINSTLTHGGLTEYLIDQNYKVVNLGYPGGSNDQSIVRIENFLTLNNKLNIQNIIVFQTEWIRSPILPPDLDSGYLELKNRIISRFYYHLTRISTKFNIPIQVVGGCSDTIWLDKFNAEYPGVSIVCQSFTNLILNGDHKISTPVYSLMGSQHISVINLLKKQFPHSELELILKDLELGYQRSNVWSKNRELFWPDGFHPNKQAHKLLFELLKQQGYF